MSDTDDDTTAYKTMRVPVDQWERAKAQKEAAGRTWGEQIVRPDAGDPSRDTPVGELTVDELVALFGGEGGE